MILVRADSIPHEKTTGVSSTIHVVMADDGKPAVDVRQCYYVIQLPT